MANNVETAALSKSILGSTDRLLACLSDLDATELNWRPPADQANSIYAIASHVLAANEGLILGRVFGQEIVRQPGAGWSTEGDSAEPLRERWQMLQERLQSALVTLSPSDMERECEHPRLGKMTAREMLLLVDRHTGEHVGHVELTRDLMKAAGI